MPNEFEPTARLNVTFNGENGDYPDLIAFDMEDQAVIHAATEGIRSGYIPGINAMASAVLNDFVVDRYPETAELPPRLMVRPKTPFGG